jgi:uncharacterized protein YbcI
VERTLVDNGQVESVYQMRRSFQQAMEAEFRQIVEEATGREVIAYMSSINIDPDLAVEVFILEPLEEVDEGDSAPGPDGAGPDGNSGSA